MKRKIGFLTTVAIAAIIFCGARTVSAEVLNNAQIHGFASQGYLYTGTNEFLADTESGSFEFNEVGVNFTAEPFDKLRIGVQLFSRDLGYIDNNRIDLDWAYADYRFRNEFGIRVGRIKTPVGLSMESMDLDMTRTTIFLPFAVYEPRFRAITFSVNGIGLYGSVRLGPLGGLDYSAIVASTNSLPKGSMDSTFNVFMDVGDVTLRFAYAGRLIWNTPLKGFLIGGSYVKAENVEAKGSLVREMTAPIPQLGGISLYPAGTKMTLNGKSLVAYYVFTQFAVKKLTLTGEYYNTDFDATTETDNPYNPLVASLIGYKGMNYTGFHSAGWYAQADYQFLDWLTAAATYSEFYYNIHDLDGSEVDPIDEHYESIMNYQKDATISLRFDINSNWNIKLETHFMTGIAIAVTDNRIAYPGGYDKYWTLYAVKTSFYF